jgi:hypothetical protein
MRDFLTPCVRSNVREFPRILIRHLTQYFKLEVRELESANSSSCFYVLHYHIEKITRIEEF